MEHFYLIRSNFTIFEYCSCAVILKPYRNNWNVHSVRFLWYPLKTAFMKETLAAERSAFTKINIGWNIASESLIYNHYFKKKNIVLLVLLPGRRRNDIKCR